MAIAVAPPKDKRSAVFWANRAACYVKLVCKFEWKTHDKTVEFYIFGSCFVFVEYLQNEHENVVDDCTKGMQILI